MLSPNRGFLASALFIIFSFGRLLGLLAGFLGLYRFRSNCIFADTLPSRKVSRKAGQDRERHKKELKSR